MEMHRIWAQAWSSRPGALTTRSPALVSWSQRVQEVPAGACWWTCAFLAQGSMSSHRCLRKLAWWSLVAAVWDAVSFRPAVSACPSCRFTAVGAAAAAVESGLHTVSHLTCATFSDSWVEVGFG